MTTRIQGSSRRAFVNPGANIAESEDAPLDVLLWMMRDRFISRRDRIEIVKICLPFVHPRTAQLHPSEPKPEDDAIDICDPAYMTELVRTLAFSLATAAHEGREIPSRIWHMMKYVPRGPDEVKRPASGGKAHAP